MPARLAPLHSLTPQRRAINGAGANYAIRSSALPAPLPLSAASPRSSLQRWDCRPDTRTHQSDHWVLSVSGAGSGDISGRLPSRPRARTAWRGEMPGALPRGRAVLNRRYGGRRSGRISSAQPPKIQRQYSSSQCQMMAPVLIRDPSSFALLRTHTPTKHITHCVAPLLALPAVNHSHHVSAAAPYALTNRQPANLTRGVALSSRYAGKTTTSLVWELEPALTQATTMAPAERPIALAPAHFSATHGGVFIGSRPCMLGWCGVCG